MALEGIFNLIITYFPFFQHCYRSCHSEGLFSHSERSMTAHCFLPICWIILFFLSMMDDYSCNWILTYQWWCWCWFKRTLKLGPITNISISYEKLQNHSSRIVCIAYNFSQSKLCIKNTPQRPKFLWMFLFKKK